MTPVRRLALESLVFQTVATKLRSPELGLVPREVSFKWTIPILVETS